MGQDPLPDKALKASSTQSHESEITEEWRTRTHLGIMIEKIPSHWMIADLKSFLDVFGTIVKVEIFEDRQVRLIPYFINNRLANPVAVGKWCSGTGVMGWVG